MTGNSMHGGTDETAQTDSATRPETDSATRPETPAVLVVEDDADLAEMYREWLRDDYGVEVARRGDEALAQVDEAVDVVLLDRVLPDISGRAVLAEIRRRDLPCQVVVVSAIDPGVDALDLGFDDYLTKPTSRSDLTAAVERSLTRRTLAAKYREFDAVATKLATLEANMDVEELEASAAYAELRARFVEAAEELGAVAVDDEEYRDLYRTKLHVLLERSVTAGPNT